jgi:hypothetical protein
MCEFLSPAKVLTMLELASPVSRLLYNRRHVKASNLTVNATTTANLYSFCVATGGSYIC